MDEWIINQFMQNIESVGLDKPWFWDQFMYEQDHISHSLQMGIYFWRPTVWWKPTAGMSIEERQWLAEKYPDWEENYGPYWDTIIQNYQNGTVEKTLPETLPVLCSCCNLPICIPDAKTRKVEVKIVTYEGQKKHFCSDPCQWIFESNPQRYAGQKTIVDRFLAGEVQPPTVPGLLNYMSLSEHEMGYDPENGAWALQYNKDKNLVI